MDEYCNAKLKLVVSDVNAHFHSPNAKSL
jgi:hypothetical protein